MKLPEITLPKVDLPFDIPVLLHPPVDHFAIALPVMILFLELINLILKKRAISGLSFFLIFLTVIVSIAAYFTGLVDGKEAYPALGDEARAALSEHKILGTYLMLASGVLLLFKLLSMLISKGVMKGIYLFVLIIFVAGIFEQGEEGGELVYEHGLNVEKVKILDDKIFELEEALEEAEEKIEEAEEKIQGAEAEESSEESTSEAATPVKSIPAETIKESVNEGETMKTGEKILNVEGMPEEMVQPEIATH